MTPSSKDMNLALVAVISVCITVGALAAVGIPALWRMAKPSILAFLQ